MLLNFHVPHLAGKTLDVPNNQFPVSSHGGDGGDVVLVSLVNAELRDLIKRNGKNIFRRKYPSQAIPDSDVSCSAWSPAR